MKKPHEYQRVWDTTTGEVRYVVDVDADLREIARSLRRLTWKFRILLWVIRIKSAALSLFDSLMGRC